MDRQTDRVSSSWIWGGESTKTSSGITPTLEDPEPAVTITEVVAKRAIPNCTVTYRLTNPGDSLANSMPPLARVPNQHCRAQATDTSGTGKWVEGLESGLCRQSTNTTKTTEFSDTALSPRALRRRRRRRRRGWRRKPAGDGRARCRHRPTSTSVVDVLVPSKLEAGRGMVIIRYTRCDPTRPPSEKGPLTRSARRAAFLSLGTKSAWHIKYDPEPLPQLRISNEMVAGPCCREAPGRFWLLHALVAHDSGGDLAKHGSMAALAAQPNLFTTAAASSGGIRWEATYRYLINPLGKVDSGLSSGTDFRFYWNDLKAAEKLYKV
ncbi:hypothetical protein F5Y12DRAFT_712727 [Xylaria sp. FL1777]|nr:hypothetical protein F5Y12DRAFT_712727 [Xylaria sp. FL1777]